MSQNLNGINHVAGNKYGMVHEDDSFWFDVLRGGSAFIVLGAHIFQKCLLDNYNVAWAAPYVFFAAAYAVYIFFVLSGLMVWGSVLRQTNSSEFKPGGYLKARLIRLYPPLILSLIVVICVYFIFHAFGVDPMIKTGVMGIKEPTPTTKESFWVMIAGALFFLQGMGLGISTVPINGALWSLSFELWFYITAMFCAIFLFTRKFKILGLIACACLSVILIYLVGESFAFGLFIWVCGAFLMWLYCLTQGELLKRNSTAIVCITSIILLAGLAIALKKFSHAKTSYILMDIHTTTIPFVVIFVLLAKKWIPNRPILFQWISKSAAFSYTLYIIHYPLLALASMMIGNHIRPFGAGWSLLIYLIVAALPIVLFSAFAARYLENKRFIMSLFGQDAKPIDARPDQKHRTT